MQTPGTENVVEQTAFAEAIGANLAFPFAGGWVLTLGACDAALDFRGFRGEVDAVLAGFNLPALAIEATSDANLAPAARLGDYAHFVSGV